jgi:predicted  nucleic acid-binding Zn-ribbon protein
LCRQQALEKDLEESKNETRNLAGEAMRLRGRQEDLDHQLAAAKKESRCKDNEAKVTFLTF